MTGVTARYTSRVCDSFPWIQYFRFFVFYCLNCSYFDWLHFFFK